MPHARVKGQHAPRQIAAAQMVEVLLSFAATDSLVIRGSGLEALTSIFGFPTSEAQVVLVVKNVPAIQET